MNPALERWQRLVAKQLTHWLQDEGPLAEKQTQINAFDSWHKVFVLIWSAWFLPSAKFNISYIQPRPGETGMFVNVNVPCESDLLAIKLQILK